MRHLRGVGTSSSERPSKILQSSSEFPQINHLYSIIFVREPELQIIFDRIILDTATDACVSTGILLMYRLVWTLKKAFSFGPCGWPSHSSATSFAGRKCCMLLLAMYLLEESQSTSCTFSLKIPVTG